MTSSNLNVAHAGVPSVPVTQPPPPPPRPTFKVGMKLEAVDRRFPYFVCVATIMDRTGQQLLHSTNPQPLIPVTHSLPSMATRLYQDPKLWVVYFACQGTLFAYRSCKCYRVSLIPRPSRLQFLIVCSIQKLGMGMKLLQG